MADTSVSFKEKGPPNSRAFLIREINLPRPEPPLAQPPKASQTGPGCMRTRQNEFDGPSQRRGSAIVQKRGSEPHSPQRRGFESLPAAHCLGDAVSSAHVMQEKSLYGKKSLRAEWPPCVKKNKNNPLPGYSPLKVKRKPVVKSTSFFFLPGTGLLRKRSLRVICQDNHRLNRVIADESQFIRYSPVSLRLG